MNDKLEISEIGGLLQWVATNSAVGTPLLPYQAPIVQFGLEGYTPQEVAVVSDMVASPVADPGQHVNPAMAAKELRKLMRLALDYMDAGLATAIVGDNVSKQRWRDTLNYAEEAKDNYLPRIEEQIPLIEEALKKRQTAPGLKALHTLKMYVPYIDGALGDIKSYATAEVDKGPGGPNWTLSFTATTSKQLKQTLARIHVLVQSLPTITGGPSNLPENVLRTIGVVLENAGYVAKKIPDQLPPSIDDEMEEPDDDTEEED